MTGNVSDVAIVGAGPVGLFAALLLGQGGLSVTVYERWPTFYPLPRACGIDHEVVRMLQRARLISELKPLLDPVIGKDKTYEFLDKSGETLLKIDWNRPGASGWAQMNMFYQPDLEQALIRRLEQMANVCIERGRQLTFLQQDATGVSLEFTASEGEAASQIFGRARYVIGADGARSTVRRLLDIAQTDLGFVYDWLVVDVAPLTERTWRPYVVQHCDPARPTTLVGSGPGRRRWEFMRLPGEDAAALNTPEKVWELLTPWDITPKNATLERHTIYTFRGSWADRWREERVFLAGDAAHLMPPFLGQGLCSGMRDAIALAWRLPRALKNDASATLLESYGPERSAHVQEIIRQAVEVGRLICTLDPEEADIRDRRMKAAMLDPRLALKPPPEPRLGESGLFDESDKNAGQLSMQAQVRHDGREGLFDDVIGSGWQLLILAREPRPFLGTRAQEVVERLSVVVADFGPDGNTVDLEGEYRSWFARLGAEAVLVRPDFYIFGTGAVAEVEALLLRAAAAVEAPGVDRSGAENASSPPLRVA